MSLERIQQAINFIEAHLGEEISYAQLARCVHMSGYDFHRMFSFVTGMTVGEYIRSRRLTLAAQELQSAGLSVTEAAYKYGYESPEGFSKVTLEGGQTMDYRMEHREGQRFMALVRAFPNEIASDDQDHSVPDFWAECDDRDLIEPMKRLCPEGRRDVYGLCSASRENETHFRYGIGVLLDGDADARAAEKLLNAGYTLWETGPADYAVFRCMGADGDCISETWSRFFKEFVPQTGYAQTDAADFEIYFEKGEDGLFCELWIPVQKG